MSDTVVIGNANTVIPADNPEVLDDKAHAELFGGESMPDVSYLELKSGLDEAGLLIDDIVLKKYLYNLTDLDLIPLDDSLKKIRDIRLFKITEMVYQKNEYSTYKFASVFSSVQSLNCGIFIMADSDGKKTDFYMGVRSLDNLRTTKSLKDTLKNALSGQFPGVKTMDILDPEAETLLAGIPGKNIATVSCVAGNKDEDFNNNEAFLQGLEKFALAMQGQKYTAIVLARNVSSNQLEQVRNAYENIYTQISPFANIQLSYGTNRALSISDALSHAKTTGENYSETNGTQSGMSESETNSHSESHGTSKVSAADSFVKAFGSAVLGAASVLTAPLTGGASLAAAGAIMVGQIGLAAYQPETNTDSESETKSKTESKNESESHSETTGHSDFETDTSTRTIGNTDGTSKNTQLSLQNKTIADNLEKIDQQLKRIEECESMGMWEGAAYFLSDSQETAEMAAGTYRALMRGERSGVETSAVNFWSSQDKEQKKCLSVLRDYITSFIHPVFVYHSRSADMPVTPATLISSNELAIQMGLPRRSVCGFPVIEHAEFGREVVKYDKQPNKRTLYIGNVYSMGKETQTEVQLDVDSLTMHTFITGSTGSGKSNTVYEILNQLRTHYEIPFMVIEPAKGEYKNVFGQYQDVFVYGTNPRKTPLLRLNPFRFPEGVHVLEHLDRLVEIFSVCWPMYAAMPAILKEGLERAYEKAGWNLATSANERKERFPNFRDLLEEIEHVINESHYSADSKGDYAGALLTRVKSLTTGLNSLIFTGNDIEDYDLFDKNVIIDLSRVGSMETKALIMGIMVMRLNEYRMESGRINSPLSHITVLEEAHNLLKRTSTEQTSESANLLGKSVELLTNSIAEMRTYGEGFIIADQSPALLDMAVVRNTNTKILLRLPEKSDRELAGYASGMDEEQIDELTRLAKGVAVIYQNDWVDPLLVKISKCALEEKQYDFTPEEGSKIEEIRRDMVRFLLGDRLMDKPMFSVESIEKIEKNLSGLELSISDIDFIESQIEEYKEIGTLKLWTEEKFSTLSAKLTDILGVRKRIEECILKSRDFDELDIVLFRMIQELIPEVERDEMLEIGHCLMKDMSIQKESADVREKIYKEWVENKRRG